MPYNETIIENIPTNWLHWNSDGKFPNPLEFKPFYPKWWEKIKSQCQICLHICQVKDVDVFDRFVNETKFNLEYHISFTCPKCKNKSYARQISFKVFEDQIKEHIKKHSSPIPNPNEL
jgi:heterodisulfide reductase subunit A-like polyferredoxin